MIGDHAQLLQVTDNLVTNAVRYGCNANASTVRIEVLRDGLRGVLRVIDQGDGIAANHLLRVTERFYRVDPSRSRESGGTGSGWRSSNISSSAIAARSIFAAVSARERSSRSDCRRPMETDGTAVIKL